MDCELWSAAWEGVPAILSGSPVWGLDLDQEPGKTEVHFPSENRPSESRKNPEPHRLDIKTVSGMLGHYSAGFTLDTYAHVTTAAQRQAADVMGNVLSGAF